MTYQPSSASETSTSDGLSSASSIYSLGAEMLAEVQRVIGQSKVKALRVKLAGHHIKDIRVNPGTAMVAIALVVVAVVISNLRVEVVKESM